MNVDFGVPFDFSKEIIKGSPALFECRDVYPFSIVF